MVALTPRIPALVGRFGVTPLILAGLLSHAAAYAILLSIDVDSSYAAVLLPTFLLVGLGFGLANGPLNVAATNGISISVRGGPAPHPAYAESGGRE